MNGDVCLLHHGSAPLLVSLPHDGSAIPRDLAERMVDAARAAPDTDWHVSRLYAFVRRYGASLLVPRYSRYVVDLNRPPDDTSLYPGQNTTGLCPVTRFDGGAVYRDGAAPDAEEIADRVERFWQPYHRALQDELARLLRLHGRVLLWEGHSIRGTLPFLFEGRLPDLNLGTVSGASCAPAIGAALRDVLSSQDAYTHVVDGRFRGGYITRQYGDPARGVHAVQLELAQSTYMDEDGGAYDDARAARLQPVIGGLIEAALAAL